MEYQYPRYIYQVFRKEESKWLLLGCLGSGVWSVPAVHVQCFSLFGCVPRCRAIESGSMADFFDSSDAQASDGAKSFEGFEAIGGGEGAEGEGFGGFDSFPTGAEVAEGGDDGFFDAPAAEGEAGAPATDAGIGWDEPTAPDGAPAADMGWGEQPIDAAPPADFEPPTEVPSFLDGTEQPDQAPVESAALMDTAAGGYVHMLAVRQLVPRFALRFCVICWLQRRCALR